MKRDSVVFVEVRSRYTFTTSDSQQLSGIIIQQIVTMPIYGKEALDICHPT